MAAGLTATGQIMIWTKSPGTPLLSKTSLMKIWDTPAPLVFEEVKEAKTGGCLNCHAPIEPWLASEFCYHCSHLPTELSH